MADSDLLDSVATADETGHEVTETARHMGSPPLSPGFCVRVIAATALNTIGTPPLDVVFVDRT